MSLKVMDTNHLEVARAYADARGLRAQLEDKLLWLQRFRDGTCECVLYPDHSPYSFYFELLLDGRRLMNGGVIFYDAGDTGTSAPQFSVRLDASRSGWEIHT
jgi:hypothetical protein